MPSLRSALLAASALTTLAMLGAPQPRAEDAGIAGAVNVDVTGTPPGGSTSLLDVGRVVVRDEHIVSDAQGLAQLLFLDQTTLTVGPNSDIVIDEFVYDPATKDGKLLMEASVGVFRLIGGEAATSGGITVGTPFATMGIRGSNIVIEISPNGRTRVTCNYCEAVEIRLLSDPDRLVTIFGSDRFRTIEIGPDGFSVPFELTPEELAQLQELLTSRPGQNGGVANIPSEPQVSQVVNGDGNSNNPPQQNQPGGTPPVEQGYNDQVIPNPKEHQENGQNQNEEDAKGNIQQGGAPPGLFFTGGGFVSTGGTITFAVTDRGWAGNINDPHHTEPIVSAELVDGRLVLNLSEGTFNLPYVAGKSTFSGTGAGPSGNPLSGHAYVDPAGTFFYYQLSDAISGRASLLFGGQEIEDFGSFERFMAWDLQPDALTGGPAPFLYDGIADLDSSEVTTSPLYFVGPSGGGSHEGRYGTASLGFSGSGANQTSLLSVTILDGNFPEPGDTKPALDGDTRTFINQPAQSANGDNANDTIVAEGRVGTLSDGNGGAFWGGEEGAHFVLGSGKWRSGNDLDVLYAYRAADGGEGFESYQPIHAALPTSLPDDVGQDRPNDFYHDGYAAGAADQGNGNGYVGLVGYMELYRGESNGAGMDLSAVATDNSEPEFDDVYLGFGNMLYIDRSRIMMQEGWAEFAPTYSGSTVNAGLVTYELVRQPDDILPGGAEACTCAFMEWGFWAYEAVSSEANLTAIVPIGSWVTGEQTFDYDDLPETGSVSYEGHAIANILNTVDGATASYMASGSLSMQVDFGSRDLAGSIDDLDGRDYAFSANYTNFDDEFATYSAFGGSSDSQIDISMNGGFFAGPQGPAQGVAGNFTLTPDAGSLLDYVGTGTFMGERQ